jgi:glycosyltransferase involved in cell wall biosynthesis
VPSDTLTAVPEGGPLQVGIDVSPLVLTRAGTARYIGSLTSAVEAHGGVRFRRYSFGGAGRVSAAIRDLAWYLGPLATRAARDRVDVLHCPTYRAPTRCSVPLVVTIHDLAIIRHPLVFNRWSREYGERLLPRVSRAADAVIAVSEFTRSETIELLGLPPERVHVVRNGVGLPFATEGPAAEGAYVLAVATLEPRKNLPRLVEGFLRARLPGVELWVAGARGWGGVRVGGRGVRWLGEVATWELARLYRGARCVAYVSLYEGFGLPVVEAMASGAPVVTSRAPALLEVGGDAAVAVDGLDPDAIAAGLEEAIERRDELVPRGVERARTFGWDACARDTVAVYRSVAR